MSTYSLVKKLDKNYKLNLSLLLLVVNRFFLHLKNQLKIKGTQKVRKPGYNAYPWQIIASIFPNWPLKTCDVICLFCICDQENDSELIIRNLIPSWADDLVKSNQALTFSIGLKAEPDKLPHADGVKLCEPM